MYRLKSPKDHLEEWISRMRDILKNLTPSLSGIDKTRLKTISSLLLFSLLASFITAGFMGVPLVHTSSARGTDTQSEGRQQRPMAITVVGNQSFLQLGEGLSIPLDPSMGRTVGNKTMYDYNSLRTLPVPIMLEFKNLQDKNNVSSRVTALGGNVNMTYTQLPFIAATVPAENVSSLAGGTVSLTPSSNMKVRAFLNESVPLIKPAAEWASLEQQVGESINGTGITIAIVDTGIDANHPDFYFDNGTSKITYSTSVVPAEDAQDYFGHGTHIAGIAAGTGAASNGKFVGVAPGASLYNIKVLDSTGSGYLSWVIAGIELAVNHTASVINLSLGANVNTDGTDPLSLACNWAVEQGVVVVVAAGNAGPGQSTVGTPACAAEVITVGASTKQDEIADFSSRGPTYDFRIKPDVVAPGVKITAPASAGSWIWTYLENSDPSAIVNNYYYTLSGTSMATPHVAGVAALLRELHPTWSPAMIKAAIMNTAQDLNGTSYDQGSGRVNAYLAATASVLAIDSSMSFGLVQAGTSVLNTTIYNVKDSPQTIEAASIDTYQINNHTSWPFVSTDIVPPVTIPVGGNIQAGIILNLPQEAPCDNYGGALVLDVSGVAIRIPHNFVYESVIIARAFLGNISLDAIFFAYNLADTSQVPSSGGGRFVVPRGTYVVHAMYFQISSSEMPPQWQLQSMFLLTEVVNVENGGTIDVNMSLDAARCINVTDNGVDGRSFQNRKSDRQLYVYFKNVTIAALMVVGAGHVQSLYLSDTQEDIFFEMMVYVAGTRIVGQEYPGPETSDAFYILSYLLHGVNDTTPTSLTCDQQDTVKYTLRYNTDGSPESDGEPYTWYPVFAPDPNGDENSWRWTASSGYELFPGVLRNLYVKYVDWNCNDPWKREVMETFYDKLVHDIQGPNWLYYDCFLTVSDLNPRDDKNKTIIFMEPPYQTHLIVQSTSGQTSCNYNITTVDPPLTELWAGTTTITVLRDGVQIPWNASIYDGAGPTAFNFSSLENGVYTVNATRTRQVCFPDGFCVPDNDTLWNRIEATAQFTVPSVDENPPSITNIDVNPTFSSNDSILQVSFNASDDIGIQYATLSYSYDNSANWATASLARSGDSFEASIPLTTSVQNVSLSVIVYDDSNNSVQYTISPVSMRGSLLTLSAPSTIRLAPRGVLSPVPLNVSDAMATFALQFYENDSFIGNVLVAGGKLGGPFEPVGYSYYAPEVCGNVLFTYVQDVSATCFPSSAQTNLEIGFTVTFNQAGVGSDFQGTILNVDGTAYGVGVLPKTFFWNFGNHTFAYQTPLVAYSSWEQYLWTGTTGLSTMQSDTINVTASGSIVGDYKTQYYLILDSNPSGVGNQTGGGWYDAGSSAPISTDQQVNIVSESSQYNLADWTTSNIAEIADQTSPSTTVLMDEPMTVTANYALQFMITFGQTGIGTDFTGTAITIDGTNYSASEFPISFWWDNGSNHTFTYPSRMAVNQGAKLYLWSSTTGISTMQSGLVPVATSGNITGNYAKKVHDVSVTSITANSWVYQGTSTNINVTVSNIGDFPENVWVTLYCNITADESIDAYPVYLNIGQNYTLVFAWNTAGVPCLNYTLTTVATLPTGSNTLSNGTITVRLMGDVNGDGRVNMKDIAQVARAFGSTSSSPNWNPAADLNGDGLVNMKDIALVARNFGKHYP